MRKILGFRGVVVLVMDIDGMDGLMDVVGGFVDSYIVEVFRNEGIDFEEYLRSYNVYEVLKKVKVLVVIGFMRINVNLIVIGVIF